MNSIEELEEALEDVLPAGFQIETDKNGRVFIVTNYRENDDGELVPLDDDDVDPDADPDFEPLEDEDELDDE
jgi:hypothetical protein